MGRETAISWCTATWNPWRGCTKVTKACDHCYMFRDQRRYGRDPETVVRAAPSTFNAPLKWDSPELIFTCSWSDWFHVDADPWRDEAWDIIRRTPQHTYMVLTKRPGRIHRCLPADWGDGYPNVWLGVSVEDAAVLHRVDQLRRIPAAMRFISAEPLLGTLYPTAATPFPGADQLAGRAPAASEGRAPTRERAALDLTGIDLIIVGGESGSRADARPMHPDWAREIRDSCLHYGEVDVGLVDLATGERSTTPFPTTVSRPAFHFKQWGAYGPDGVYKGATPDAGGKLLDGVEWCELPVWEEVRA